MAVSGTYHNPVGPGPTIIVKDRWIPEELRARLHGFNPRSEFGRYVRECLRYLPAHMAAELVERVSRIVVMESGLWLVAIRANGQREDYGLVGQKYVTDTGVGFIVDAFQNIVELEIMKYHGLGTGSTGENQTDAALVTELTTEYTGNIRATGTTVEGASANIYSTVATNILDGTPGGALREHGVFSANAAGVLLDRTVYAAITLSSGDSLQSTYQLTLTAGG